MNRRLTARQSRLLALGMFLVSVMTIACGAIIPAYGAWSTRAEQADALKFQWLRYQGAIQQHAALRQTRDALQQRMASNQSFYPNLASGVVAARMQERLRKAVLEAGGDVLSTQALSERDASPFQRITVNLRLRGNDSVLNALLITLQQARPLLSIEKLWIKSHPQPAHLDSKSSAMTITLEVSGYRVKDPL